MPRLHPLDVPIRLLLIIFMSLAGPGIASATTFYVASDGSDKADGTTPGHPFKTLNWAAWVASSKGGDELLFHRGGVWRESLTVPINGTPGHPFVLGAYGDGDRPCIDGGDPIEPSKFAATDSPAVFRAQVDHPPETVWEDIGAPLTKARSLAEVAATENSFWCDGTSVYVHPSGGRNPRLGQVRFETPAREVCIEISKSQIALRSISIRHATRPDRGAVTVWANQELSGIELSDCDISYNCGRGVWIDGPATSSVHDVLIQNNEFRGNEGSGALLILAQGGQIAGNKFEQNCHTAIEPWQAAIRLWSGGVGNLVLRDNTITDQRWGHDHDSSMGIHCDETGDRVLIENNLIRNVDHAGIEIENTRGVTADKNTISDCNIGLMLNRAGHNHIVRGNTITNSRSQGLAMQGWRAHGVDAGPEILVDGRLFTRNLIENNSITGSRWGNLKAIGGAEQLDGPLGNIFRNNNLGPERPGFIEWGDQTLDRYDQWPAQTPAQTPSVASPPHEK